MSSRLFAILLALSASLSAILVGCNQSFPEPPPIRGVVDTVTSPVEFDRILSEHDVVLVDFYADWCGPCKKLRPTIEAVAGTHEGKAKVIAVDVDAKEAEDLALRYQISSIPDIRLFKGGKQVEHWIGVTPFNEFDERIQEAIK